MSLVVGTRILVVGALLGLMGWGAPTQAAWDEPTRLARGDVVHLDAATTPEGQHVTLWAVDASGSPDPLLLKVGSAAPLRITADTEGAALFDEPSVVVDAAGRVTAVWVGVTGRRHSVRARTWSPVSGLGEEVVLSGTARSTRDRPAPFTDPLVQVDDAGDVVVAWRQVDPSASATLHSRTLLADGGLGQQQALNDGANHVAEAVLLPGPDGLVELLYSTGWGRGMYADTHLVRRVQDRAGHFTRPEPLGDGTLSAADTDDQGRLVMSWFTVESDDFDAPRTHWVRVRDSEGSWGPDRLVGTSKGWDLQMVDEVLLADDGRIHVLATTGDYDKRSLVTLHPDGHRTVLGRVMTGIREGVGSSFPLHVRTRMVAEAKGALLLAWPGKAGVTVATVDAAGDKVSTPTVLDPRVKASDDHYEEQSLDVVTEPDGSVRAVWGTWIVGGRGSVFEQTWR